MKYKTYEVKDIEEAIGFAVDEFGLSADKLEANTLSEKKGFLGIGNKLEVEVKTKGDGVNEAKAFLQTLMTNLGAESYIEKKVRGDVVEFNIDAGDMNGVLIGKNSKHLVAVQTLLNVIVNNFYDEEHQKIVKLDIGGYRRKREYNLERMAVEFGKQVAKTKHEIKLDHLNSYERKVIHDKLSSWTDITTHSEGEEPDRYLIISPKK